MLALFVVLGVGAPARIQAQNNAYSGLVSGKWENGANWSLGIPPNLNHSVRISNGVLSPPLTKTVTIDAATAGVPSSMIVNDLRLGSGFVENTLSLNNAGLATPLNVQTFITISNNGILSIANSGVIAKGSAAEGISVDGALFLNSGFLLLTNSFAVRFAIGYNRNGFMNMSGGTWTVAGSAYTELGSKSGTTGALLISGGLAQLDGQFFGVGVASNATGRVLLTGGELRTIDPRIGVSGTGQMTVSNGLWRVSQLNLAAVGFLAGGSGTLTLAGGTSIFSARLIIGNQYGSTGTVQVAGGELLTTNSSATVGYDGQGQMSVTAGVWRALEVGVGTLPSLSTNFHTLSIAGGTTLLSSNLSVGNVFVCATNNLLAVSGGSLTLSNAAHDAKLLVTSGTFALSGGTVKVDTIDLSNPCAHFARTGGTLIYTTAILDPARDDDGDGMSNALEQATGYDPLNAADGLGDPDGDGIRTTDEVLAGTNPNSSNSYLRILSLQRQGDDVRLRWFTAGGKLNAIQAADSIVSGTPSNFTDLAYIPVAGSGDKTNTFVDVDAAKQGPARFYRIKLVP